MTASILQAIYIFTAILGVGITAIDLAGLLATSIEVGSQEHHANVGQSEHSIDANAHSDSHLDSVASTFLSSLFYLRIFVYFALGFGPTGLITKSYGYPDLTSAIYASTAGLISATAAYLVFKIQNKALDSSLQVEDLFLGKARVIVTISNGQMGKVRIATGQSVTERYAIAEDPSENLEIDAEVEVVSVHDDHIVVRRRKDLPLLETKQM
ncbi:MAG: hypothetical protein RMM17_08595 [Acidobacteriota bacterium]|nr:hypothetical protein [Blastocatellia bacterium]MDW8412726.1 hypothetical protein [Acidobacteriota bacterium]